MQSPAVNAPAGSLGSKGGLPATQFGRVPLRAACKPARVGGGRQAFIVRAEKVPDSSLS